ncbi:nitrogen fixation protein NifZ [Pelomonas cellulosilytica]|uniref:nitrogen fixation protein NifZ n=1 Tax=Pelomonas cellulosilytica TaxID=2906762 RepID=UPI003B026009
MLMEPAVPKYQWGQPVIAAVDLYNDGSHPDVPEDQLMIVAGGPGEIVQVGHHTEANVPIYMVDFGLAVVGCMEHEILPEGSPLPEPEAEAAEGDA